MRYEEILKQLEAVDLKEKFTADFEDKCSINLLNKIKTTANNGYTIVGLIV